MPIHALAQVEAAEKSVLRPSMPELDTIRGLAILGVLLYHGLYWNVDLAQFSPWQRHVLTLFWVGRLGVDLFFVLSGFLITGILLDSVKNTDYYRRFYFRRALRILPIYLVIIAILAILRSPASFIVLSLLYLSNLTPLFGVAIAYPVLWSLAVEEHFYFAWPWIVRKLSAQQFMAACVAVILLSPISRLISFHVSSQGFVFNEYTWNALDGLACGALLATAIRFYRLSRKNLLQASAVLISSAVAIEVIGLPFGILTRQSSVGAALQVVPWHLAFTAILATFLVIGTGEYAWLVQSRVLGFLGYISYGLYLVHLLIFRLVDGFLAWHILLRVAIAGSLSILVAFVSRKYFEQRFIDFKNSVRFLPVLGSR